MESLKGLIGICLLTLPFGLFAQESDMQTETLSDLWEAGEEEVFSSSDLDDDGFLSLEEFAESSGDYFKNWDADQSGRIERGEWKTGISQNYGFREYAAGFDEWDIRRGEGLDSEEFAVGLFKLFDNNGDKRIDKSEFQHWNWESPDY